MEENLIFLDKYEVSSTKDGGYLQIALKYTKDSRIFFRKISQIIG